MQLSITSEQHDNHLVHMRLLNLFGTIYNQFGIHVNASKSVKSISKR